jgi:hypothetical protein
MAKRSTRRITLKKEGNQSFIYFGPCSKTNPSVLGIGVLLIPPAVGDGGDVLTHWHSSLIPRFKAAVLMLFDV